MRTQIFLFTLVTTISLFLHQTPIAAVQYTTAPCPPSSNATDFIRSSCTTTLYPDLCYTSLSRYASAIQKDPARLAKIAISVSLNKAQRMANYVSNLSRQVNAGAVADPRTVAALRDCYSNFGDAVDQIRGSITQMRQLSRGGGTGSLRFQLSNVQTWMSAALTNEDTCTDGFEEVADGAMKHDVCNKVVKVKKVTSNALALVNSFVAKTSSSSSNP